MATLWEFMMAAAWDSDGCFIMMELPPPAGTIKNDPGAGDFPPDRSMLSGEWDEMKCILTDMFHHSTLHENYVLFGPAYKDLRCQYLEQPVNFVFSRHHKQEYPRLVESIRPQKILVNIGSVKIIEVIWHPCIIASLEKASHNSKALVTLFFAPHSQSPKPYGQSRHPIMARRYTVDELLLLRKSLPFIICDVKKLNKTIFAEILHLPEEAHFRSSITLYSSMKPRSRASSRLQSSLDDEEERIVYRGHPARRLVREVAWNLRRRDSTDWSNQPLSAPAGPEAQKADNFRKFYRAVVSPTHVRVTAGGRIVPNTRAPPQPMFSWNADTHFFGAVNQSQRSDELDQQQPWLQGVRIDGAIPMPHDKSGYHIGSGNNIFSSTIQSAALSTNNDFVDTQVKSATVGDDSTTAVNPLESEVHNTSQVEEIKISPANQFDTSKPFLYNGQWVYPVPPGFRPPVLPFNLLGNANLSPPAFIPQVPPGMFIPQQLQFPTPNMVNTLSMLPGTQHGPLMSASGLTPLIMSSGLQQVNQPPHSMIPGSYLGASAIPLAPNLIGHHLQTLQQQLKHLENQLENNKHQIDESHVLNQQHMIRNQIATLQTSLSGQAYHQISRSQRSESSINGTAPENLTGWGVPPTLRSETTSPGAAKVLKKKYFSLSNHSIAFDQPAPESNQIQPAMKMNLPSITSPFGSGSPVRSEPSSRKRLSAAAAMAPPFLPRNMQSNANQTVASSTSTTGGTSTSFNPLTVSSSRDLNEIGCQNGSVGKITDWKPPSAHLFQKPSLPKAQTTHSTTRSDMFCPPSVNTQSFSLPNFPSGFASNYLIPNDEFQNSIPYMMGFPPPGSTFENAASSDLVYQRKLTEEEQRARHLYWGKAPREATRGLPKFDGRDFYPPSPVKAAAQPARTFESEFIPSRGGQAYEAEHAWQSKQRVEEKIAITNPQTFDGTVKTSIAAHSNTSINTLKHKKTWEKLVYKEDDDACSVDSWGVTSTDKREIFAAPASRPPSIRGKISSPENNEFVGSQYIANRSLSFNSQPSFLQGMLKNSPLSAMSTVLTGSPSSTTAQGYLPQYRGSAAAALAPSMSSINASSQGLDSASVYNETVKNGRTNSMASFRSENRPPMSSASSTRDAISAADMLRRLNKKEKEHRDPGFNANTMGVGPTYSADW